MTLSYYKVMKDSELIGVGTTNDLRLYSPRHNWILACNVTVAQFIEIDNKYYHDYWMIKVADPNIVCIDATITEITEEQYNALHSAKEAEESIDDILAKYEPVAEKPTENELELEYIRSMKIAETSLECRKKIQDGLDIVIDGTLLHFSYAIEDQLELMNAMQKIAQGKSTIFYHADNQPYKEYNGEEIQLIYNTLEANKTEQRQYFNKLKTYINSLSTLEEINSVTYGITLPE